MANATMCSALHNVVYAQMASGLCKTWLTPCHERPSQCNVVSSGVYIGQLRFHPCAVRTILPPLSVALMSVDVVRLLLSVCFISYDLHCSQAVTHGHQEIDRGDSEFTVTFDLE